MDDLPQDEIRKYVYNFLVEFKNLMVENDLSIMPNVKNKEGMLELGLTIEQRKDIVLSLSVSDYNSGPINDILHPGDYWIFGKKINIGEIYIKLRIVEYHGREYAVCYSFHKSEHRLIYPFVD